MLDNCEPEKWHVRFQRVNHQFGRGLQHMPFCARFIGLLDFSYCFVRLCRSDLSTSGFASLLWSTSLPPWLLNLSKLFVCHWCSAAAGASQNSITCSRSPAPRRRWVADLVSWVKSVTATPEDLVSALAGGPYGVFRHLSLSSHQVCTAFFTGKSQLAFRFLFF